MPDPVPHSELRPVCGAEMPGRARSNLQWGKWFGHLWEDGDFTPSPMTNSDLLPTSTDLLVGAYGADKVAVYR